MFTEFGACFDGDRCATEINNSVDAFDLGLSSWAYWQYKSFADFTTTGGTAEGMFNSDGTPQAQKLKAITRTYAHAFQGTPEEMFFQTANASFKTSFSLDKTIDGLTEIYLNEALNYPDGYKLTVTDQNDNLVDYTEWREPGVPNYISLDLASTDSETIKVNLTPANVSGTSSGTEAANGYSVDWSVEES